MTLKDKFIRDVTSVVPRAKSEVKRKLDEIEEELKIELMNYIDYGKEKGWETDTILKGIENKLLFDKYKI